MREILLDTNYYLSFFTKRDESQFEKASNLIKEMKLNKFKIIIPSMIIAEIVYTLNKYYEYSKENISELLISLISEENVICSNKQILTTALLLFSEKNIDFPDCYLIAHKENLNMEIFSFDKKVNQILCSF